MSDNVWNGSWFWWAGSNGEYFTIGPCPTRDEALQSASDERVGEFQDPEDKGAWKLRIHLIEARQDPLRLSRWIDIDKMLEEAEESVSNSDVVNYELGDDGPFFDMPDAAREDLEARIKGVIDAWQIEYAILHKPNCFSATRNAEVVVLDTPLPPRGAS